MSRKMRIAVPAAGRRGLPRRPMIAILAAAVITMMGLASTTRAAAAPTPVAITEGANQITSNTSTAGSWCLDNSGGSNAAGNPIDIYPCNDTWDGQLWTVEKDGTIRIQNRCLDAPSPARGTQLVLEPCDGTATPGEQWQPMSDGSIENVWATQQSLGPEQCMGITGGDPVSKGTKIIIWDCNGADTQQWHLPAASTRAAIAAARLQLMYDDNSTPTYLFNVTCGGNCWWWSANEINALVDYARKTSQAAGGSVFPGWARYQTDANDTFYHYYSGTGSNDGFITHTNFFDDMGWWGLTWLNAYGEYGNTDYLAAAEDIASYIHANAWTSECGGGAWQTTDHKLKDAIVNELFFELAARLHRTTGNATYLTWAKDEWNWIKTHLIIEVSPESSPPAVATPADLTDPNAHLLVADHVFNDPGQPDDCTPATGQKWSYNQGVILGALHSMYKITGDSSYLPPAEAIANTVETDVQLSTGSPMGKYSSPALVDWRGTLSEPCQSSGGWPDGCDVTASDPGDNNSFLQYKGIFIRNLDCLAQDAAGSPSYNTFISTNAGDVFSEDQNLTTDFSAHADLNLFGFLWDNDGMAWPGSETAILNGATQGSALDALVSNMAGTPNWC